MAARRSYGTGSLTVRADSAGRETWYGKWHSNGRRVKRRVGPKRAEGGRDGLTRAQAEAELRRLMAEVQVTPAVGHSSRSPRPASATCAHLERAGRKRSTIAAVESALRVQLVPFFADKALDAIRPRGRRRPRRRARAQGLCAEVDPQLRRDALGAVQLRQGAAAPLGGRRTRARASSCPGVPEHDEIRFLDEAEWEAVLRHVQPGAYEAIDRAFYLTAIMAGLRHGELIALRWRDVDWLAGRIRVRQNYVLGEFDTPKSRSGEPQRPDGRPARRRARPALQGDAGEPGEDALVFADPITGEPLDKAGEPAPLPQGAQGRGARRGAQPARAAPHVRDADGRRRRADADAAGVDGAPRHRDDAALRGLRAEPARGRADRAGVEPGCQGSLDGVS